jgi:hypothetical protein
VGVAARSGAFQSQARAARDGTFVLFTGGPAARISAQTLPLGYFVKSLTYGNIDLLRSPLTLDAPASGEILLTLTTTPPTTGPRGFSVSGKITGIPETARSRVALVLHGPSADDPRTERAIEPGQTAFEIRNVPPGAYSLGIVGPDVPRDTSSFRSVVVIDGDVHNADLAVTMH